jgi:outer membrane protein OmpA-like peptidoglycan-associated protein
MEIAKMIRRNSLQKTLTVAFLVSGFAVTLANRPASAEELSAQQIVDGLKVSKTRSMGAPAMKQEDVAFIKRVRGQTRSLSTDDRERIDSIAADRPKVNLDITFDYNSADVTSKAEPQLNDLGKALTSSEMSGAVIVLGGHTDAKGTDEYNQGLSERRAETVKHFLIEKYHIPAANFISAGYGKKGLKNAADPMAPENRRVEIVNAAQGDETSK